MHDHPSSDGAIAHRQGFGILQNPYPAGSSEALRWHEEWRRQEIEAGRNTKGVSPPEEGPTAKE